MKRFFALLFGAILALPSVALAAPMGQIKSSVEVCDPNSPTHCIAPASDGSIPVTLGGSSTVKGTATAAAPSYSEGTDNPLSMDLNGGLRTVLSQATPGTTNGVSVAYIGANSVAVGSGPMTSGVQRFALATDSPGIVATSTVAPGAAPGQALVAAGIYNSSLPTFTAGQTGGVQLDSNGRLITASVGDVGAAPPGKANYVGANGSGATGGLLAGLKTCDQHAKYDASDTGRITMVTGVSGRKVYICGYIIATAGTATNLALYEGSDANCATNSAPLTPVYVMLANQSIGALSAFWTGLVVSTNAYYVCISASAANAHQAEIWYTIQ